MTKDEAQRRNWTFYEFVKVERFYVHSSRLKTPKRGQSKVQDINATPTPAHAMGESDHSRTRRNKIVEAIRYNL